jgi:hypothetical protein
MLRSLNRQTLIGAWVTLLVAVAAVATLSGVPMTADTSALWFAVCLLPPAVMLMVWRGAPEPTVAEIFYAVDRRTDPRDARPASRCTVMGESDV